MRYGKYIGVINSFTETLFGLNLVSFEGNNALYHKLKALADHNYLWHTPSKSGASQARVNET